MLRCIAHCVLCMPKQSYSCSTQGGCLFYACLPTVAMFGSCLILFRKTLGHFAEACKCTELCLPRRIRHLGALQIRARSHQCGCSAMHKYGVCSQGTQFLFVCESPLCIRACLCSRRNLSTLCRSICILLCTNGWVCFVSICCCTVLFYLCTCVQNEQLASRTWK